jgi:hypothetical protein
MDTAGVERVDFNALGGADLVTVNDLTATDVNELVLDLAATFGGGTGDGQADRVVVNATDGNDAIDVSGDAGEVKVNGLAPTIRILHSRRPAGGSRSTPARAQTRSIHQPGRRCDQLFVDSVLVPREPARRRAGPPSWGPMGCSRELLGLAKPRRNVDDLTERTLMKRKMTLLPAAAAPRRSHWCRRLISLAAAHLFLRAHGLATATTDRMARQARPRQALAAKMTAAAEAAGCASGGRRARCVIAEPRPGRRG